MLIVCAPEATFPFPSRTHPPLCPVVDVEDARGRIVVVVVPIVVFIELCDHLARKANDGGSPGAPEIDERKMSGTHLSRLDRPTCDGVSRPVVSNPTCDAQTSPRSVPTHGRGTRKAPRPSVPPYQGTGPGTVPDVPTCSPLQQRRETKGGPDWTGRESGPRRLDSARSLLPHRPRVYTRSRRCKPPPL